MKKILVVLVGGGHTKQILRLVEMLGTRYSYEYVIGKDDNLSEKKIKLKGKIFRIINPRGMEDKGIIKTIFKFIPSSFQALSCLLKSKSDVVLACGPAISIHACILGRIFGKKVIFLESWSRVYTKSLAGRFVYPFANLFFIQWKEEQKNYEKAVYVGRLG